MNGQLLIAETVSRVTDTNRFVRELRALGFDAGEPQVEDGKFVIVHARRLVESPHLEARVTFGD